MQILGFEQWLKRLVDGLEHKKSWHQIDWGGDKKNHSMEFNLQYDEANTNKDLTLKDSFIYEKLVNSQFPKAYKQIVCAALRHNDERKWKTLYQFTQDYLKDNQVIKNPLNPNVSLLLKMKNQISRDVHKMRAFVRFQELSKGEKKLYTAFYNPDHYTLKPNTTFFKERFSTMNWVITTPFEQVAWNQSELFYQTGKFEKTVSVHDPFEDLWTSYFASTFNPGRLKIKAMKNEMPTRFWKDLPEAKIIPDLIKSTSQRVETMKIEGKNKRPSVESMLQDKSSLLELKEALPRCRACSLCENGSRPVFSAGSPQAQVMIVGEAPDKQEEKESLPFRGSAAKLLRDTLEKKGLLDKKIYFTNTVKHFHFQEKAGQRFPRKPSAQHIMRCRGWLMKEIALIKPQVIIGLGPTSAQGLLGFPLRIDEARISEHKILHCEKVLLTHNPDRILRERSPVKRKKLMQEFQLDLVKAFA